MRKNTRFSVFTVGVVVAGLVVGASCAFTYDPNKVALTTFSISGTVSGAIAASVTVTLTGDKAASTTTDSSGNFSFSGLAKGAYTITPSLTGYTFEPSNKSVVLANTDLIDVDFVGTAPYHPAGSLAILAGVPSGVGNLDGAGANARFHGPRGMAIDQAGNLYVADVDAHTIRKITPEGVVSTLAGMAGQSGSADGMGAEARFFKPISVAVDEPGNVYVADSGNHTIRSITPDGVVSTFAGMAGISGSTEGMRLSARFKNPLGVTVDGAGNVYVADTDNHTIRKITPQGIVSTLAGMAGQVGISNGAGTGARFYYPHAIAANKSGSIYVLEGGSSAIRKITPEGVVSAFVGGTASGTADGTGSDARFCFPYALTVDVSGYIYVADTDNHTIRKVTPQGVVSTIAGRKEEGSTDGLDARFSYPQGVAADGAGNVYVSDNGNRTIRKVAPSGVVSTIAGAITQYGSADGTGVDARFGGPNGVAVDGTGNVYVADGPNYAIRKIAAGGIVSTVVQTPGWPVDITIDVSGNLYLIDANDNMYTPAQRIDELAPGGTISTLAGTYDQSGSADGVGANAQFNYPAGVAVDGFGYLYVADSGNQTIRKITPDGTVSTLAGRAGQTGTSDGAGGTARFDGPSGVAADGFGNLYVSDTNNHTIRKIGPDDVVSTFAGTAGQSGSADGMGVDARFSSPGGVAVDGAGNLYVADAGNFTIRKITPEGMVSTPIGVPGREGTLPGPLPASIGMPLDIAIDPTTGNLLIVLGHAVLVAAFQ